MTGTEIYKRTATYEKEARNIRIHAPHWKLLLAFDGQRTLSEVAISAETTFADAVPLTQKFLSSDWIEECPITLDQYLKRIGAADITKTGATVAPAIVLQDPKKDLPARPTPAAPTERVAPAKPVAAPAPLPPMPTIVPPKPPVAVASAPAIVPPPLPIAPAPPVNLEALAAIPAKVPGVKTDRALKLSAVVDFITSLVGNISLGQLLVYRVFLRVPPELLLAEDVASVHLANDTSLIKSEKLQKAINDAVNAVTKRTLPDSVYAAA